MEKLDFCDTKKALAHKKDKDLLKEKWLFKSFNIPILTPLGTKLISLLSEKHLLPKVLLKNAVFYHFCGGETFEEAKERTKILKERGLKRVFFYSVEGASSLEDHKKVVKETLKAFHPEETDNVYCALKLTGLIPIDLLEKIQKKEALNQKEENHKKVFLESFATLCEEAEKTKTHLMIDAEETWVQKEIDALCLEKMEKHNKFFPSVYTTIQMYRKDGLFELKKMIQRSKEKGFILGIKLVRGAYIIKENERAKEENRSSPIHDSKENCDKAYNEALELCFQSLNHVALFAGSHNTDSMKKFAELYKKTSVKSSHLMTSQLNGMCDFISFNLAQNHIPASKYIPFGPAEKAVPYLIRRAEENSSILGDTAREIHFIEKELKRRRDPSLRSG